MNWRAGTLSLMIAGLATMTLGALVILSVYLPYGLEWP